VPDIFAIASGWAVVAAVFCFDGWNCAAMPPNLSTKTSDQLKRYGHDTVQSPVVPGFQPLKLFSFKGCASVGGGVGGAVASLSVALSVGVDGVGAIGWCRCYRLVSVL